MSSVSVRKRIALLLERFGPQYHYLSMKANPFSDIFLSLHASRSSQISSLRLAQHGGEICQHTVLVCSSRVGLTCRRPMAEAFLSSSVLRAQHTHNPTRCEPTFMYQGKMKEMSYYTCNHITSHCFRTRHMMVTRNISHFNPDHEVTFNCMT